MMSAFAGGASAMSAPAGDAMADAEDASGKGAAARLARERSVDARYGFATIAGDRRAAKATCDRMPEPLAPASCDLCPRACGADRASGARGTCGASDALVVARAALHFWEEPPISGDAGSGTVFFAYCPLRCVYCQNAVIAAGEAGAPVSVERLAEMCLELEAQGALNVNFVTPTHYAPQARAAVAIARGRGLALPVLWNTSGYETAAAVRANAGTVDAYLTDFKYADAALAARYSHASDYPDVALAALEAMVAQTGPPSFDRRGRSASTRARHGGAPPHAAGRVGGFEARRAARARAVRLGRSAVAHEPVHARAGRCRRCGGRAGAAEAPAALFRVGAARAGRGVRAPARLRRRAGRGGLLLAGGRAPPRRASSRPLISPACRFETSTLGRHGRGFCPAFEFAGV